MMIKRSDVRVGWGEGGGEREVEVNNNANKKVPNSLQSVDHFATRVYSDLNN